MRMLGWEDFAGIGLARFEIGMIESCGRDDSDSDFECKAEKWRKEAGTDATRQAATKWNISTGRE